jgi:DNA-binding NarL/FixJ family response regulator
MFLKDVTTVEICGEASDGIGAVEKAKHLKPDLVVLDLALPGMNGAEVASVLERTMRVWGPDLSKIRCA